MLLDNQNLVSNNQSLVQAAGTYLSDFSIDLGATGTIPGLGGSPNSDPGKSDIEFIAQIVQTFTSGGAATLQVNLVMADDAALTTNLVVLESTPVLALATLVAGYQFRLGHQLPVGITKRYIGLQYIIGTAAMTAGKVTAGVIPYGGRQTNANSI
jgi:hypothetical protein